MVTDEIDFDSPAFQQAVVAAKEGKTGEEQQTETTNVEDETTETSAEETTTTQEETTATTEKELNYAEYLTTKSGGLFKSEEDFIAALDKVKNYDSLETKLRDTETKLPQFKNEETKAWFDLVTSEEGKKALKEYISETDKDYHTMSDIDVRREALQKEHPQWSKKDIDLELRHKYGKDLELKDTAGLEDDELESAETHNAQVEKNLELLAVHARDDRYSLIEKQKLITLPEIKKTETTTQPAQLTEAEIAEGKLKWQRNVEETLPKLSNIKTDIDDKGVEYISTDDDKAALASKMKDFNIIKFFGEERGWQNPDKTWNALKIAEDVRFLTEGTKVIKSIAGQVKTEAIRATMAKIKGIDPNYQEPGQPKQYATFEEAAAAKIAEVRKKRENVEYEEAD